MTSPTYERYERRIPLVPEDLTRGDRGVQALARAAIAAAQCVFDSSAHPGIERSTHPGIIAKARWPGDRGCELIIRAASNPATLSDAQWAGALGQVALAYLKSLTPLSAGADLLQRGLQLTLDGASAVGVPSLAAPDVDFVGHGRPIPMVRGASSLCMLEPYKLAVVASLSREMIEGSNAEVLVRQALIDAGSRSIDKLLLSTADAVAEERPAGLMSGVAALPPTSGGGLSAMTADLVELAAAVAPFAGNGGMVYVAAVAQATAANLQLPKPLSYPVLASSLLPAGTVVCVAVNALASAMAPVPRIEVSRHATVHRETNPQPIVSEDGTVATPVGGIYQLDSVLVRLIWPMTWGLRASGAVAWKQNVTW